MCLLHLPPVLHKILYPEELTESDSVQRNEHLDEGSNKDIDYYEYSEESGRFNEDDLSDLCRAFESVERIS